jgi:hypothetical protein
MNKKAAVKKLDELLDPIGFMRQKDAWNRRSDLFIEVVDVQISNAGDSATINAGVLDTEAFAIVWGAVPPAFIEQPACTVRARVGELIDGRDQWWKLDEDHVVEKLSCATADVVLPFIERMRSRENMLQWLKQTQALNKTYPLPIINFAVLQHLIGESAQACERLAALQKSAMGAWSKRASDVAARLGCAI